MEEEVVIIVTRKQANALPASDAADLVETSAGLVRKFTGDDRFKRACKLLRALDAISDTED